MKGIEFKKRTICKYVGRVKRNSQGPVAHPGTSNKKFWLLLELVEGVT